MARRINSEKCIGCGRCEKCCIVGCISEQNKKRVIDESACVDCGACELSCPVKCIEQI